ncbi:MAG: lipase family protein [Actinobacteria bacterium]|nr:lipase family protein [Actinomycetota bacterium]MCL6104126.1 lipase family protein [Actinomycetota bacterium]
MRTRLRVLDSVRAAAQIPGLHLSRNIVIVGHSQGGQVALFAGQLAPSYAPDLHIDGVVAMAPATNLSLAIAAMRDLSDQGGITSGKSDLVYIVMTLWAWAHTYRHLPVTSIFTPFGAEKASIVNQGCLSQIAQALAGINPASILRPNPTSMLGLLHDAAKNNPGLVHTITPILVVQGNRTRQFLLS